MATSSTSHDDLVDSLLSAASLTALAACTHDTDIKHLTSSSQPIATAIPFWAIGEDLPTVHASARWGQKSSDNSGREHRDSHHYQQQQRGGEEGEVTRAVESSSILLQPGHALEIVGDSSTGKTEFLYQAAMACAFPSSFCGLRLGGHEEQVVWIDVAQRFNLSRFLECIEARVRVSLQCLGWPPGDVHSFLHTVLHDLVVVTLSRISIVPVASPADLSAAIASLDVSTTIMQHDLASDLSSDPASSLLRAVSHARGAEEEAINIAASTRTTAKTGHRNNEEKSENRFVNLNDAPISTGIVSAAQFEAFSRYPRLVIVDDITDFYWQKRCSKRLYPFYDDVASKLSAKLQRMPTSLIVASSLPIRHQVLEVESLTLETCSSFATKHLLGVAWQRLITHRLVLRRPATWLSLSSSTSSAPSGSSSTSHVSPATLRHHLEALYIGPIVYGDPYVRSSSSTTHASSSSHHRQSAHRHVAGFSYVITLGGIADVTNGMVTS